MHHLYKLVGKPLLLEAPSPLIPFALVGLSYSCAGHRWRKSDGRKLRGKCFTGRSLSQHLSNMRRSHDTLLTSPSNPMPPRHDGFRSAPPPSTCQYLVVSVTAEDRTSATQMTLAIHILYPSASLLSVSTSGQEWHSDQLLSDSACCDAGHLSLEAHKSGGLPLPAVAFLLSNPSQLWPLPLSPARLCSHLPLLLATPVSSRRIVQRAWTHR